MTRERALYAKGLAQHRHLAERQARPSAASNVASQATSADDSETTSAGDLLASLTSSAPLVTSSSALEPVERTTESTTSSAPVATTTSSSIIVESSTTSTTTSSVVTSSSSSSLTTSSTLPATTSSTEAVSLSRSTITVGQSTNVIIRSITQTPSSTASIADASTTSAPTSGPGTGAVVGIVAGALVGVVVLASLIGYFFKAKWGKDDDDIDDAVFNKNDFRRDSTMLPDDDGMSMRSGSVAGYHSNLSHSNSVAGLPGLARGNTSGPRPPSILERHYLNASPGQPNFPQHQQNMPSFQVGQMVQPGQYYGQQPQYDQYGYPVQPQQGYNAAAVSGLDRAPSAASYYSSHDRTNSSGGYTDLSRANSNATTNGAVVYPPGAQSERPLSEISEGMEEFSPAVVNGQRGHNRNGTPEDHNPQYYFRSHVSNPSNGTVRSTSQNQLYEDRRLSIRNHDDAYSGM